MSSLIDITEMSDAELDVLLGHGPTAAELSADFKSMTALANEHGKAGRYDTAMNIRNRYWDTRRKCDAVRTLLAKR